MNKLLLIFVVVVVLALALFLISGEVKARDGKTLKGEMYVTPMGDPVEVLDVPGFGKCLFASAYVICK